MGLQGCNFMGICTLEFTGYLPSGVLGKALCRKVSHWGPSTPKLPEGGARGGCWSPGAAHPVPLNQHLAAEEILESQEPSPEKQHGSKCRQPERLCTLGSWVLGKLSPLLGPAITRRSMHRVSHMPGRQRALQEPVWKAY